MYLQIKLQGYEVSKETITPDSERLTLLQELLSDILKAQKGEYYKFLPTTFIGF